jgi:hypothetical protein
VLEDRQAPAVLTVNSTADTANPSDPYLSLREAITLVNSPTLPSGLSDQILGQISGDLHAGGADTIGFDPAGVTGPILLGGTQLELSLPGSAARVTIGGGEGVTLSGTGSSPLFQIDGGAQAVLDHLTLTHEATADAAAITTSGASLVVANCTLTGNRRGGISVSDSALTVINSTLTGNSAGTGAGINAVRGSVTVTESSLSGNSAGSGGALSAQSASVTVADCTLSGNSAGLSGGGIAAYQCQLTVVNSTLAGNSALNFGGGGIDAEEGSVTVTGSVLTGNTCYGVGGGISAHSSDLTVSHSTLASNWADQGAAINAFSATLTVSTSSLTGNSTTYGGGAITAITSAVTVADCTLTGNSSTSYGALDAVGPTGSLTVTNSTLAGNTVRAGSTGEGLGGAIYCWYPDATVSHCTVVGNSATRGGGLYHSSQPGTFRLEDTIVAGNRADAGENGPDVKGAIDADSSYNLIGAGDSTLDGIRDGSNHNRVGTSDHPLAPRLAPLGWYGGPTRTFALLPDSPARGAGDPDSAPETDQRGLPRLAGGPSDIGAFQSQADPFLVTTLEDPGQLSGLLSLREAIALADVLPGDNAVSFDDALGFGIVNLTAGQLQLSGTGGVQTVEGSRAFTVRGDGTSRLFQIPGGTQAVLDGLDLSGGQADSGGGVLNQGTLTVAHCTLYGNTAGLGGGVCNQGSLTVYGSTLAGNLGLSAGGGLYNAGSLTAYNSTFVDNAAPAGGAIHNAAGTATLTSLTVSRNAADEGGGLDVLGGLVLLRNCIVAGNTSAEGVAASDIAGTVDSSSRYNLIGTGGSGGLFDGVNHNLVGVADPGLTDPDFGTPDTAVFGFTADSPAVGAGDPSLLDDPVLGLDQHGNVRNGPPNIGAV